MRTRLEHWILISFVGGAMGRGVGKLEMGLKEARGMA